MEKLHSADFEEKLKISQYVVIDFSSPGCAPCTKIPPLISRLLEEMKDLDISAFEVNVAEQPEIAGKYFVLGVPTLIIFREGQEIARFNSVPKLQKIMNALK